MMPPASSPPKKQGDAVSGFSVWLELLGALHDERPVGGPCDLTIEVLEASRQSKL